MTVQIQNKSNAKIDVIDVSPVVSSSGGMWVTVPCMSVSRVEDSPDTKQEQCRLMLEMSHLW